MSEIISKPRIKIEIKFNLDKNIWVTAFGEAIPVEKMHTSHINNCINCLEGKGRKRIPENYLGGKEKWLKIFKTELLKRQ